MGIVVSLIFESRSIHRLVATWATVRTTGVPTSPVPRGVSARHGCRSTSTPGPLQGDCTCAYAGLGGRRTTTLAGVRKSQGRSAVASEKVWDGSHYRPRFAGSDLGSASRAGTKSHCTPPPEAGSPDSASLVTVVKGIGFRLLACFHVCSFVSPPSLPLTPLSSL